MATSLVPTPLSYQQILGQQLNTVRSRLGIRKFKPGGQLLTIFEAASQADARNAADIFTALQTQDLDNAEGQMLDRIGADEDLPRRAKKAALGAVTISDTAFQKLSSTIYHGKAAPIVGSVVVYVSKGNSFDTAASTGQIYLGRGTPNYEGPIAYSAKVDSGSFWSLTLSAPTIKFHNLGESVILAQGGLRPIPVGQTVTTTQGSSIPPTNYTTTQSSAIADGETSIENVPIVCSTDGIVGNVVPNSIVSFGNSSPFPTSSVTNPVKIDFGRDIETDNSYRDRIRQARANKQRGTDISIKNAVIDISSPEETSSILSANVVRKKNLPTILYIDDGNGYEEKSSGLGYESVIDSATGGETDFTTVFSPIAQAYIETQNLAPWTLADGAELTIRVGGVSSSHFFDTTLFSIPLSASAYDIVSSINGDSRLLFQARVTQNGLGVAIFSKSETNDDLQVISVADVDLDASVVLGLSTAPTYTTSLYKNDILLSKDGVLAQLISNSISTWSPLATSENIIINVDGTGDFTYTITDATFQALGYAALNNATTVIWANVLNNVIPGITATNENDRVILTSNRGKTAKASLAITGGTLVVKGAFAISSSTGTNNDYSIDRSVGSLALNTPLTAEDRVTLGTNWAEAFVQTDFGQNFVSLTSDSNYYLSVDDPESTIIPTSVFLTGQYSTILDIASPTNNYSQIGTPPTPTPVPSIQKGDWVLLTDPVFNSVYNYKGIYRSNKSGYIELATDADLATRIGHTSTSFSTSGPFVVVMGGCTSAQNGIGLPGALKGRNVTGNCQLYNPTDGSWTQLSSLITPRAYHTATLLSNGNIFIAGGFDETGAPLNSTEIFDTTALTFSPGPTMATHRAHHTATLLGSGNVLIVGGSFSTIIGTASLSTCTRYNPTSNTFISTASLAAARYGHQSVSTGSDTVVSMGGVSIIANPAVPIATVESYSESLNSWTTLSPMHFGRCFFGAAYDGTRIVVAGTSSRAASDNGLHSRSAAQTFEVYTGSTWSDAAPLFAAFPSNVALFSQNDLVVSDGSRKIAAAYVSDLTAGIVRLMSFDVSSGNFVQTGSAPFTSNYVANREGTTAAKVIGSDVVAFFGGATSNSSTEISFSGICNTDQLDLSTGFTLHPYAGFSLLSLTEGRLLAVRSKNPIDTLIIPSNSSFLYGADALAPVINTIADDVVAEPFQTTKLRLSTLSTDGSLLIADKDIQLPAFTPVGLTISQRSQFSSINSKSSISTPQGFQLRTVGAKTITTSGLPQLINVPDYSNDLGSSHSPEPIVPNGTVVGLRNYSYGANTVIQQSTSNEGNAKTTKATIGSFNSQGTITETATSTIVSLGSVLGLRQPLPVTPGNPVYISTPYTFSVTDTLNVNIDGDTATKRFIIPMARKMSTVGSYASPLTLKDADNSNLTISTAFGIDYDFNDFAIVSRARVISDATDSTKSILWRYSRFGEEGNNVAVRYAYPLLPSQSISVSVNPTQKLSNTSFYKGLPKVTVDVNIGSGAIRRNRYTSINTRFGVSTGPTITPDNGIWNTVLYTGFTVLTGSRPVLNGPTYLQISVPNGFPGTSGDPNIQSGDVMWYDGSSPASSTLQTGQFTVLNCTNSSPGVWNLTIPAGQLNDGTIWALQSNPGTISTDPSQKAYFDSDVIVGDLVTINLPDVAPTTTMVVTTIDTNRQYMVLSSAVVQGTTSLTPTYQKLNKLTDLAIFAAGTNTASAIATAVNAANAAITATVVGSGTGVISNASWYDNTAADFRYLLTDAINYVLNTNQPANTTINTTFDLKCPVSSSLVTNNDFSNEIFYIVPSINKNVVNWLNTPAITGLWSAATVTSSENNTKVQIKSKTPGSAGSVFVEGGNANLKTAAVIGNATSSIFNTNLMPAMVVTTTNSEAEGFQGNTWVKLNNTDMIPKVTDNTPFWGSGNRIATITTDGLLTFVNAPYQKENFTAYGGGAIFDIERVGDFVCVNLFKAFNSTPTLGAAGNWIYIKSSSPSFSQQNQGVFKILRFTQTESVFTYWIKNDNAIDQQGIQGVLVGLSEASLIPGDKLYINSDRLGANNKGSWTITEVGHGYTDNTITLSIADGKPQYFNSLLFTFVQDVTVIEKDPNIGIKKLLCISPNPSNPNNSDMLLDDDCSIYAWNSSSGTVIAALDKLGFDSSIVQGTDAYRYNTGLVAEAKRVVYGDSADVDNYPGYAADGARILIQGPTIKRIFVTLQIRLQNNVPSPDTVGAIKAGVAGLINANAIGTPIAISDIVSVAQAINGVIAVSVMSPTYNSVQDQIPVSGQEKAMVVDLENDIKVLITGN